MKMYLSSQIASCLNIVIMITIATISLIAAIAILYIAGSHLGYPFGQFILCSIPNTRNMEIQPIQHQFAQKDHANPSFSTSASGHAIARGLGQCWSFSFVSWLYWWSLFRRVIRTIQLKKKRMGFMAYGRGFVSGLCGGLVNLGFPAGGWTDCLFSVGLLRSVLLLDDHFHYGFMWQCGESRQNHWT